MAEPKRVQLPRVVVVALWLAVLGFVAAMILLPALPLLQPVGTDVSNKNIRSSAKLPVLMWCLGWPIVFIRRPWWPGRRTAWTLGCLLLITHIAVAFHLGHGWSHDAAWEHTRQVGGYGDGIFVNYAFALVWFADVAWVWVSPSSYLVRPRWLHWTIHGFIAFVVFNAAVVFASWESRLGFVWWFVAPFALLSIARGYLRRRAAKELAVNLESGDTSPVDKK